MSTLKEIVQQRRTIASPSTRLCESDETLVRTLQIHAWNGEKWVLPWSHFSAARHRIIGENEQLALTFANHEVVVEGSRLALLLNKIACLQLDCLRDMPAIFEWQAEISEPYISRVSARSMFEPTPDQLIIPPS